MKIKKNTNYKAYSLKNLNEKDAWESENIWYLKSNISRIGKLLSQYEIYKKIIDLPGSIVELGVFKGASISRLMSFRKILENDFSREVYGFDTFKNFPVKKNVKDPKYIKNFLKDFKKEAGPPISKDELITILEKKNFENYELIEGDVFKTIPKFIKRKKHLKIALLHIDLDLYDGTKFILEKLSKYVVSGGIIMLDDYGLEYGETKAVDEFLKKNKKLKIRLNSMHQKPSYIIM
jgi:hypothetical protein